MGFKAAGQLIRRRQLVGLAKKIHLLRQRPAVVAGQQINEARVQRFGIIKTTFQAFKMLPGRVGLSGDHAAAAEYDSDIFQRRFLQASGQRLLLFRDQRYACFDAAAADAFQLADRLLPRGGDPPKAYEKP